ncbi:MAG: hypothetical protein R2688_06170 [Fimbriimonadaceae bacterium]
MLSAALLIATQTPTPAINPASVYGMRTYTKNASFGFLAEKMQVGFVPDNIESMTTHILDAQGQEVYGGKFYEDPSNYPNFRLLRVQSNPQVYIEKPGKYAFEFRNNGQPISKFPFEITRKSTGDEFNPTYSWEFITPVDKMGYLYFDSSKEDGNVYVAAWIAPCRENLPNKGMADVSLTFNGKQVAGYKGVYFTEPHNRKYVMKMGKTTAMGKFAWSDLQKLTGTLALNITINSKGVRKFVWNITSGKPKAHPRSASDYSPRTDYWIPRILGGMEEGYQNWTLLEQYWATSAF